jgi:hypothetical protein
MRPPLARMANNNPAPLAKEEFDDPALHPFLKKPDRLRAYQDLRSRPRGTYREWADRWCWTLPRVFRFLASLEREGLANVRRTRFGTIVELHSADRNKTVTQPELNATPSGVTQPERDHNKTVKEPEHLGSLGRETGLGPRPSSSSEVDNYTAACIDTMNEQLGRLHVEYRPVLYDNQRSGLAVDHWKAAGVELGFAIEEIRKGCVKFNPSKHGRGNFPGTLGYFERGVLNAHAARHQTRISLPPVVQRGGAWPESSQGRAEEEPVLLGTVLPAFLKAYEEGRQAGARP